MNSWYRILLGCLLLAASFSSFAQDIVLDEAVVTAKGSGITVDKNQITYNVSQDSLAANKRLSDLVSGMPLVVYDRTNEKLQVAGSENICILLNGRKSLVINKSNYRYISELLRGSQLESITIDTNPTGAYAHYSAVIDIKSATALANFYSGNVSLDATTAWSVTPTVAFTGNAGRLTSNITYRYDEAKKRPEWNYTESRKDGVPDNAYMSTDTTAGHWNDAHNLDIALSYDISKKDILFVSGSGKFSKGKYDVTTVSDFGGNRIGTVGVNSSDGQTLEGSVAYQHYFEERFQKLLTLQYSINAVQTNNIYGALATDNNYLNRQQTLSVKYLHTIDYTANWHVNTVWFSRKYLSNSLVLQMMDHSQDVLQSELNATKRFDKIHLTGIAAFDYTFDKAIFNGSAQPVNDNYALFRYQVLAIWFPAAGHILRLSAGKDVYRPDISVRNPYRNESVSGVVTQGNPQLSNEKSRQCLLSYTYMKGAKFSAGMSVSYINSTDGIFATTRVLEDGRLLRSYENGIGSNKVFTSVDCMWRPSEKFFVQAMYNLNWNGFNRNDGTTLSYFGHSAYLYAVANPWLGGEIALNAFLLNPAGQYTKESTQVIRNHYTVSGFVSIGQRFGNFSVGLQVKEPWYKRINIISEYAAGGQEFYSVGSKPGQIAGIYLRYTFGKFRSSVKRNTQQVRDTDRTKQ